VRLGEQIDAGSDLAEMYRNVAIGSLGRRRRAALDACLRALGVAEQAGPLYLGDAALSLARACAEAAKVADEGSPLLARAKDAAKALEEVLTGASPTATPGARERAARARRACFLKSSKPERKPIGILRRRRTTMMNRSGRGRR